ncbi:VOC family protein [Sphingobium xenophagum]|uniref:VOC family protein n=1 Tax=Sphingobium xenophagum TaxID=121428 RepID=UPI0023EA57C2|nr:VOC family protein [Sphingobium xenophagum]
MTNIAPCLWFDGQAEEAAHFYASVFGGSVDHVSYYPQENLSPSPAAGAASCWLNSPCWVCVIRH